VGDDVVALGSPGQVVAEDAQVPGELVLGEDWLACGVPTVGGVEVGHVDHVLGVPGHAGADEGVESGQAGAGGAVGPV